MHLNSKENAGVAVDIDRWKDEQRDGKKLPEDDATLTESIFLIPPVSLYIQDTPS